MKGVGNCQLLASLVKFFMFTWKWNMEGVAS